MPGTYMLPSLATVFHALYAAGGVNNVGTLRDVVLYRNGKAFKHVDVYDYITVSYTHLDVYKRQILGITFGKINKRFVYDESNILFLCPFNEF